jgi:hypothetical protein
MNDYNSDIFKRLEQFLTNKYIFCKQDWLKEKIELYKTKNKIEDLIYQETLSNDINSFIDSDKVNSYLDLSKYNDLQDEKHIIKGKYVFSQINSFTNIAEPKDSTEEKEEDNEEENEQFESKYLQSEEGEKAKVEKLIFKLGLFNGKDEFIGFEYEPIKPLPKLLMNNKFCKVLIGPTIEVRRGIYYLKNDNFKFL